MQDFFGYNRQVQPNGQIYTSEYATLTVAGAGGSLVQQVQAQYMQVVNAKFETGSPTLYWVTGQPSGVVQFSRLVGRGGFFKSLNIQNSCGTVIPVQIGLNGTGGCPSASLSGGNTISFSGGVAENVTVGYSAGMLEVSEGAALRVAAMNVGT